MIEKKNQFDRVVQAFKNGPEVHVSNPRKNMLRIEIHSEERLRLSGTDIERQGVLDLIRALNDGLAALR